MNLKLSFVGLIALCFVAGVGGARAAEKPDNTLPVRGFCIGAPGPDRVEDFIGFIDKELGPRQVNVLILRVDYNYQYESHPELRDGHALSKADVKRLVTACQTNHI